MSARLAVFADGRSLRTLQTILLPVTYHFGTSLAKRCALRGRVPSGTKRV